MLRSMMADLPHALVRLAEPAQLTMLGGAGGAALGVRGNDAPWSAEAARSTGVDRAAEGGSFVGSGLVQAGAAAGTFVIGAWAHSPRVARIGGDLIEAQLLNGLMTQSLKFAVARTRPNGGRYSFPSGHTSASFATAMVLEHHFGWRIGAPMMAVGAYVALARVHDLKHYPSDVLFGAGLGLASGRAVTRRAGGARVTAGLGPVPGGAALAGSVTWVR
jgi:membrane-associated phospholipid phosphatase